MNSSGPKSSRKPSDQAGERKAKISAEPAISREEAVRQAVEIIVRETPQIAKELTEAAKKGNCQAARFLFDFAGLSGAAPAVAPDSLAAVLLRQLALPMETEPGEAMPSSPKHLIL